MTIDVFGTRNGDWRAMKLLDGYTLTHEHLTIDLTPGDLGTSSFDELVSDLRLAYGHGVRNIIDLTNRSMGRDVAYVKRLSEATGINIVMSTGHYLECFSAPLIEGKSVDELAEQALHDLTVGMDGSGVKAGVIGEIAWSKPEAGELELRSWEAMARVARQTGAVVSTHPSRGIQQLPQAEFLIARGVAPERIQIGHIEFHPSDEALQKLLDLGVYIGVDMVGKAVGKGDEYRADLVAKLKSWGRLPQTMLSCDLCRKEDLRTCGGYGYAHLFEAFIPMLLQRGLTHDDIDLMLRENPRRLYA